MARCPNGSSYDPDIAAECACAACRAAARGATSPGTTHTDLKPKVRSFIALSATWPEFYVPEASTLDQVAPPARKTVIVFLLGLLILIGAGVGSIFVKLAADP